MSYYKLNNHLILFRDILRVKRIDLYNIHRHKYVTITFAVIYQITTLLFIFIIFRYMGYYKPNNRLILFRDILRVKRIDLYTIHRHVYVINTFAVIYQITTLLFIYTTFRYMGYYKPNNRLVLFRDVFRVEKTDLHPIALRISAKPLPSVLGMPAYGYIYACVCIHMYLCIYVYTCIYINTHIFILSP
jgi:hypothetical protein